MFLVKTDYTYFGPGPVFYSLTPLDQKIVTYFGKNSASHMSFLEEDRLLKRFPHGGRRFRSMRQLFNNRLNFVQVAYHTAWTERRGDLSAEVLDRTWSEKSANMPSLDLRALHHTIEMTNIDFNDAHREYRQNCYFTLLSAYFKVTTDLDILARSEPHCSDEAKQLIVNRIAEYADPTRELLTEMATTQLYGRFKGDIFTEKFQTKINDLITPWSPAEVAVEASDSYIALQSDQRVQSFLALRTADVATH